MRYKFRNWIFFFLQICLHYHNSFFLSTTLTIRTFLRIPGLYLMISCIIMVNSLAIFFTLQFRIVK